jgi:hypothetical protein
MSQLKRDNKHLLEDYNKNMNTINTMTKEIEAYADNETKMKRQVYEAERDVKILNKQVSQMNARINGFVIPDDVEDPVINIDVDNDDDDIKPEVNTIDTNDTTNDKIKKPKGFQSLASKIKAEEDEKRWAAKQKEANDLAVADRIRELDKSAKDTVTGILTSEGPLGLIQLINDNLKLEHMVWRASRTLREIAAKDDSIRNECVTSSLDETLVKALKIYPNSSVLQVSSSTTS